MEKKVQMCTRYAIEGMYGRIERTRVSRMSRKNGDSAVNTGRMPRDFEQMRLKRSGS
jgi:hypothetical protein